MLYRLDPVKQSHLIFLVLVLCAIIGPLSIDLFTPSLPALTEAFDTTPYMAQWTVSIFMLGFAISMLVVGPVSERFGNCRTLVGGYAIYLIATLAILFTRSIEVMIAARLIQAIAGCFGTALSRAIARDLYKGKNDVRILGMIGASLVVAPMVAPVLGGFLQELWGWQASFIFMLAIGVLTIVVVRLLPDENKGNPDASFADTLNGFSVLFRDRRYMVPALTASLAFAGAFVFVVGAPFVLIGAFELSPKAYGAVFAFVMGAYILSSMNAGRITDKLGRKKATNLSWTIMLAGAAIAFGSALLTDGQLWPGLALGLVVYEAGLGLFLPSCQAKALSHLDQHAGTGSGLIFFLEMIIASGVSFIAGKMVLDNTLPLAGISLTMILLALALSRFQHSDAEPAPEAA
ncbi:multidrug effflux MFS transporter [Sansalvadorimonas sp. 2012CJ34-2]|uniref:Bcr/CflA family efflux transporter n=1 Tax=Parendozoicomonas callyspongiae TaxID=2942213 RepID=A0ABT0PEU1_9GAMM|nr:multidrug effflux MFS transporter [Sansalvadorimonas sp. 2012CJ34-2]MCL6269830.1 multidrug effflux MFS transporter [Sansalvadorimonas sp. 2012CJ34-2]